MVVYAPVSKPRPRHRPGLSMAWSMDQMTWQGSGEVREVVQVGSWHAGHLTQCVGRPPQITFLFYQTQQDGSVGKVLALQE